MTGAKAPGLRFSCNRHRLSIFYKAHLSQQVTNHMDFFPNKENKHGPL
jgi:hypothetical protein